MEQQSSNTVELNQEQQDMLRSLLDSELVLIGGGEAVGYFN
jgi:hypothetical protein